MMWLPLISRTRLGVFTCVCSSRKCFTQGPQAFTRPRARELHRRAVGRRELDLPQLAVGAAPRRGAAMAGVDRRPHLARRLHVGDHQAGIVDPGVGVDEALLERRLQPLPHFESAGRPASTSAGSCASRDGRRGRGRAAASSAAADAARAAARSAAARRCAAPWPAAPRAPSAPRAPAGTRSAPDSAGRHGSAWSPWTTSPRRNRSFRTARP